MKIEVLGPGCPRCMATMRIVKQVVDKLGIKAEIEHVHDVVKFIERGVMMTPAVVIDGEVKTQGKIPGVEEVEQMIKKEMKKAD